MPEIVHLRAPAARAGASTRTAAVIRRHTAALPRTNVTVFRAALAMVALAVVDDAYVHPEAGVTAGDHIVSGLAPLALLGLLIAIAGRLPSLLRGWLAVFAGALAIVGGISDGVRHILVDRVSGDDVTAVLAGLAGAVLRAPRCRERCGGRGGSAARARPPLRRRPRGPGLGDPDRAPDGDRDHRHPQGSLAGSRREPWPPLRVCGTHDERRSEPARLVRPVNQRRGGHRLPRPVAARSTREDAHPSRLRRPPARPPRRGRKRGRLQRLRLGR